MAGPKSAPGLPANMTVSSVSTNIGILLSNLGTPEGTDYWSMGRYLAEFLSDRRVIEMPRAFRVAPPYFADDLYVGEISRSITGHLSRLNFEPEVLLASFHGMPKEAHIKGDPYFEQCQRTGELVRARLGLPPERLLVTFQSRFGSAE
jgi:protoheme ferro-lyase